ncbi:MULTISPECIES: hypothetical protein [Stutzerimonas stutzeri subgroup]|uniref:hypothetical protein n=1 Tax=Stutzerimonas stutzeri subgroup TaxID=578833 RepID=UPI001D18EB39|nr:MULTISPECIES: hypothetical protein [Stutzerimonas stutzeri subgroup]UEG61350.1 hypothetical protein LLJ08_19855 [Stutzerimonas chloritidismutans]
MTVHSESGAASKRLLRVMVPTAMALWALVAMGTTSYSASLDGRYASTGQILLSNGELAPVSQSVVFRDGRFYSMTRNSNAIVEASGRVETDLLGRARLIVEEGEITSLIATSELDDELVFNLLYGKHKGARITLEQVGTCLYGVETQQVYCADHLVAQR